MFKKMKKFFTNLNENGYAGLVETLVGSVIVLLVMGATAMAINTGLQATLEAKNSSKAVSYIEKQFILAKNMPYKSLGINTTGEDNKNIVNPISKDMVGCSNYSSEFENELHVLNPTGLNYCEIIANENGEGVKFNVETHVTSVTGDDIINDFDGLFYDFDPGNFTAKRVTVIVTWFDGKFDANKLPVLNKVQSELVVTPGLGDCVPSELATASMGCDN